MNTQKEFQICLGGIGGQGVMLAAKILGLALSDEGYNVLVTSSHGIEARGGVSFGEVIYGNRQINLLKVAVPDVLLALSEHALGANVNRVAPGGYIFYDSFLIREPYDDEKFKVYSCPFTGLSFDNFGTAMLTNLIAIGFINAVTGITTRENLENAVAASLKKNQENNLKAIAIGYEEAAKHK